MTTQMTTEQILKAVEDNAPLLEILAKTIEMAGVSLFETSDLVKGIDAMKIQWEQDWIEMVNYQEDDDDYDCSSMWDTDSSMLPDNFQNDD